MNSLVKYIKLVIILSSMKDIMVFITRRLPSVAKDLLSEHFEVHENNKNEPFPKERLYELVSDYDGILSTVSEKFTKEVLEKKFRLKVISNYAVGLNNIDLEFAKSHNISVYNTPDVVTNSTADMTFALLLSLIRKIPEASEFIKKDKWKSWDPEIFLGEELYGKTFGIIGFGRIGKAVARRALGFGFKILFYNPSLIESSTIPEAKQVDLDELLKKSDYISIHSPLNDKTKNMINSNLILKMIKKPIIINMARGEIVETNDLLNALKKGLIRGVALDVTNPEPINYDNELLKIENCIITPHIGTATKECRHNMAKLAAENLINHFKKTK